jgi:hypothetical protein
MKRLGWLPLVAGVAILPLGGCMAMGMHGMHHDAPHQGHQSQTAVVAELRAGEVIISLEYPAVAAASGSTLTVTIRRAQDGAPVSGAIVVFAIQPLEPSSAGSTAHPNHVTPVLEYPAEEGAEKGTYQLKHPFADHGRYQITARVWLDAEDQTAPPLVLTATAQAVHQEKGGHNPMGLAPMSVAGGLGMVLMMSIMMGRVLF